MFKMYSIRTISDLDKIMQASEIAGELTTREQAKAILNNATYEVLQEYAQRMISPDHYQRTQQEKRNWLISCIVLMMSDVIALNAQLIAKYRKPKTVSDAKTAVEALAEADTREEMRRILQNLSVEELEKVEKSSVAEFVKKTNLINLIISYVEYFKSQKNFQEAQSC